MSHRDTRPRPGPDFICIGAQKAGTGWLYEQLRGHDDFWMPPMKELHYFDRVAGEQEAGSRSLPYAREHRDRIDIARDRARDQRDRDFLTLFARVMQRPSENLDQYVQLFVPKGDLLAGDITPGYSTLSADTAKRIVSQLPATQILFIARDPVERAWSQLSMYVRRRLIEPFDAADADALAQHLARPEIAARSYPSQIVRRWRNAIEPKRFTLYFFDHLQDDPGQFRARIVSGLGGDPEKPSGSLSPGFNAKAEKPKLSLSAQGRSNLARFFRSELEACARELGGPAETWPSRYRQ